MNAHFQPTPDQVIRLAEIVTTMATAGVSREFIAECARFAHDNEGFYELMELWLETEPGNERDAVLADLHELIEDAESTPREPLRKAYIRFDQLDEVAAHVMEHKTRIRALIDRHGGISEVARRTGIPQPSLSRMLKSASMPRRRTLNRIAVALDVPESEVVGDWVW